MGTLIYSTALTVTFDDRVLAHLQIVIAAKLRRHDSFFFSWNESLDNGGGRSTAWIDHTIPMVFRFSDRHKPQLNKAWLEILALSANSAQGLLLTGEPDDAHDSQETVAEGQSLAPAMTPQR